MTNVVTSKKQYGQGSNEAATPAKALMTPT